ncbi:MAG: hypothetical protein ISR48_11200 [Alphaproteobacteria bacterium]|nr:hypothetical protein [Alphaproteobacteria bacterium]
MAEKERTRKKLILEGWEKEHGPGNGVSAPPLPKEIDLAEEPPCPSYFSSHDGVCYALQHTKKAFDFFTYLSSQITDRTVREAAEHFAKDEISHIAVLRLERIKANRHLREYRQGLGWWCDPENVGKTVNLGQCFAAMEAGLAHLYGWAGQVLEKTGGEEGAAALKRYAADAEVHRIFHGMEDGTSPSGDPETEEDPIDVLLDVLKATNQALEFAFLIAEKATDDEVLAVATSTAEKLSGRLETINRLFEKLVEDS